MFSSTIAQFVVPYYTPLTIEIVGQHMSFLDLATYICLSMPMATERKFVQTFYFLAPHSFFSSVRRSDQKCDIIEVYIHNMTRKKLISQILDRTTHIATPSRFLPSKEAEFTSSVPGSTNMTRSKEHNQKKILAQSKSQLWKSEFYLPTFPAFLTRAPCLRGIWNSTASAMFTSNRSMLLTKTFLLQDYNRQIIPWYVIYFTFTLYRNLVHYSSFRLPLHWTY